MGDHSIKCYTETVNFSDIAKFHEYKWIQNNVFCQIEKAMQQGVKW